MAFRRRRNVVSSVGIRSATAPCPSSTTMRRSTSSPRSPTWSGPTARVPARRSTRWAAWRWSGCSPPANHSQPAAWRRITTLFNPSRDASTAFSSSFTPAAAPGSRPPPRGQASMPYRRNFGRSSTSCRSAPTSCARICRRRCWFSTPRPRCCGTGRCASRTPLPTAYGRSRARHTSMADSGTGSRMNGRGILARW